MQCSTETNVSYSHHTGAPQVSQCPSLDALSLRTESTMAKSHIRHSVLEEFFLRYC